MSKEKIKHPISEFPDEVRRLESEKYVHPDFERTLESGNLENLYEWFEDKVIEKEATVEIKIGETGKESAIIRMVNPKTKKEEMVYFTEDEVEVKRLKAVLKGQAIKVEIPEIPESDEIIEEELEDELEKLY